MCSFIRVRRVGLWAALVVMLFDQASKYLALQHLQTGPIGLIENLLAFRLAWNTGISFSFFNDLPPTIGPWLLSGFALLVSAYFLWWMKENPRFWSQIGLGLIVGGALGNVIDRVRFGAVVDFIHVYRDSWHFPIFNVADSAINVGVALLLLDMFLSRRHDNKQ